MHNLFLEKLDAITVKNNSTVCVGLDTDREKIPIHLRNAPNPLLAFNAAIIEATRDLVQCYKLNFAFYEAFGTMGHEALRRTITLIPRDVVIIADAKRGDIGNTSAMYARAIFEDLGCDAVTVAPYMGEDSVGPFLAHHDKGVFVLALTSNPGSRNFQYLDCGGRPLYEQVVRTVLTWNRDGNCGLVVGATHPSELAAIRALATDLPILIPGLGAQGGDMVASVRAGVTSTGMRGIFNNSRAILYADSGAHFADAARNATIAMRDEINRVRDTL